MIKKLKEFIIHLFGGYTEEEYESVEKRYNKLLLNNTTETNIQLANETTYRNLTILEEFAKKLYGIDPKEWSEKMYKVIHDNRIWVLVYHLSISDSHSIFKIDPYKESYI